ncbi:DNA topoisomerase 3 [Pseudobacillus sp. 179-B 2D1 NHS]|uniref:DNA topoisomerase 3 n=1 Tax=Pseudobacillus sp. 179-B 2D1 NHS TaxID=3374292 RepID=UPI00387A414B
MPSVFILAEKPMAAEKLASPYPHKKKEGYFEIMPCPTFPKGAYIGYCIGHLIELCEPADYNPELKKWSLQSLPIMPSQYKYRVSDGKQKILNVIRQLLKDPNIKETVVATDAGREGSNIAHSVLNFIGDRKPRRRLWISSLTQSAVKKGFEELRDGKQDLLYYEEAKSRQISDWLVGINLTRALTLLLLEKGISKHFAKSFGSSTLFSVGRVQSPVLKMIVDREKEIQQFKSTPFWTIKSTFKIGEHTYEGKWFNKTVDRFTEKEAANHMASRLKGKLAVIQSIEKERITQKPPQFFNLSSLQVEANKQYSYTSARTLEIAQSLYVRGYLSYPRSDSAYITADEAAEFPQILQGLYTTYPEYAAFFPLPVKDLSTDVRYTNPKLVSDHHAILPTEQVPKPGSLSKDEMNIYDLVVRRLIAAHSLPATIDQTKIITVTEGETFLSQGKVTIEEGFQRVLLSNEKKQKKNKENNEEELSLPPVEKGLTGLCQHLGVNEAKTKPPARFTPGTLINIMKHPTRFMEISNWEDENLLNNTSLLSLGTESTRSGILEKLRKEELYYIKSNKVYASEKGILLIEALGNGMILCSPELTAKWELVLSKIGKGEFDSKRFIDESRKLTIRLIEQLKEEANNWDFAKLITKVEEKSNLGTCPKCKKGNVQNKGSFFGCSAYKEIGCTFSINRKVASKEISETQIRKLLESGKTDLLKGFKGNAGNTFDAILEWNDAKQSLSFKFPEKKRNNAKILSVCCPFCSKELVQFEKGYACSGAKLNKCSFSMSRYFLGSEITVNQLTKLVTQGQTDTITVKKDGKTKKMKLKYLKEEKKVQFLYVN